MPRRKPSPTQWRSHKRRRDGEDEEETKEEGEPQAEKKEPDTAPAERARMYVE